MTSSNRDPKRARRLLVLLGALAILAASCGGGSDSDADEVETTEAQQDQANDAPSESVAPTTQAAATGSGDFCQDAAGVNKVIEEINATTPGLGDRFEAYVREAIPLQIAALENAPEPITDAGATFAAGLEERRAIFEANNFDVFSVPEEQMVDDPAFDAAADEVVAYIENECGIQTAEINSDAGAVMDPSDVDRLLASPNRDQMIGSLLQLGLDEDDAECAIRAALTDERGLAVTQDTQAMFEILTDCGMTVDELIEIGLAGAPEGDAASEQLAQFEALLTPEVIGLLQTDETVRSLVGDQLVAVGLDQTDVDCLMDRLASEPEGSVDGIGDFVTFLLDCGVSIDELSNLAS